MDIDQKDNDNIGNSFTNINLSVSPLKEKKKNSQNSINVEKGKKKNSVDSKEYNSKSSKKGRTPN
jgi:hypothetical protein